MNRLAFSIALAVLLPALMTLNVCPAASANADDQPITSQTEAGNSSTSDEIIGLRIDNINKNGADFHWSTSVATNGSVEYAYTKSAQISGSQQNVAISVLIKRVVSDPHYRKEHHIRVGNLDMYYHPFVEYTITSETRSGEVYTLSGEFVLVDTGAIPWSQTWWFTVGLALFVVFLGYIPLIRRHFQSRKAKKR